MILIIKHQFIVINKKINANQVRKLSQDEISRPLIKYKKIHISE